jgi:hypothetical protein
MYDVILLDATFKGTRDGCMLRIRNAEFQLVCLGGAVEVGLEDFSTLQECPLQIEIEANGLADGLPYCGF